MVRRFALLRLEGCCADQAAWDTIDHQTKPASSLAWFQPRLSGGKEGQSNPPMEEKYVCEADPDFDFSGVLNRAGAKSCAHL